MNESLPRRIVVSQAVRNRIIALGKEAKKQGQIEAYARALATIQKGLENRPLPPSEDPAVFGDPRFHLPNLDMLVCVALVPPVAVNFGVALQPQKLEDKTFIGIYVLAVNFMS